MSADGSITAVADVPTESTFLFTVRDIEADEQKEAILVRLPEGDADTVTGWLNYCQHFMHITLDKGSGAPMRDGEILCANHGAYFEQDTGLCTYGPCKGAYLNEIEVRVEDGEVYLDDEAYEFCHTGPIETDDTDLASESNVEF